MVGRYHTGNIWLMVRSKLNTKLSNEAERYLGLPYWQNRLIDGKITKEGFMGGKGNWHQINQATKELLSKLPHKPPSSEIYNLQKKNHIGIDCSGLAYNLLNFLSLETKQKSIEEKVVGTGGKFGIRRVSSNLLTSPANSIPVTSYQNIQPGDLIRLEKGRHVIVILKKVGNTINYIHSSNKTLIRGVHLGTIKIINPKATLEHQHWIETTKDNQPYSSLFNSQNGDGIFRLKCLS